MNPQPRKSSVTLTCWHAAFIALLAAAPLAQAHPGHSFTQATPAHLLTSPDHLAVLALLGTALCLSAQCVQRRLPRRALQCAGSLAVLGAVVLFNLRS